MPEARPSPDQLAAYDRTFAESRLPPLPMMKELWRSGCWLAEVLDEMGMSEPEIKNTQEAHGRACFGRDPWSVCDRLISNYRSRQEQGEKNMQAAKAAPELVQEVPEPSHLLTSYLGQVEGFVGDKGLDLLPFLHRAADDGIVMEVLDLSPIGVMQRVETTLRDAKPVEFVYGLDRFIQPDQGFPEGYGDFVGVIWFYEGTFYTGVIAYRPESHPEGVKVLPVDWNNKVWNHMFREQGGEVANLQKVVG